MTYGILIVAATANSLTTLVVGSFPTSEECEAEKTALDARLSVGQGPDAGAGFGWLTVCVRTA